MKKLVICQNPECAIEFEADMRELNRGNANYCGLACAAKIRNSRRISVPSICSHCGQTYSVIEQLLTSSRFCSDSCKQKNYRAKKRYSGNTKMLYQKLKLLPCEVCSWDTASRDVHHILPVKDGGKDEASNLISLCPNHHRLAHSNLLSQDDLFKIAKSRTISSS